MSPIPLIAGILRPQLDKIFETNHDVANIIENSIMLVNLDVEN
jgi:hypothetical protein